MIEVDPADEGSGRHRIARDSGMRRTAHAACTRPHDPRLSPGSIVVT